MFDTDEAIAASVIEGHNIVKATRSVVQTSKLIVADADHQLEEAIALKMRTHAMLDASLALLHRER